MNNKLNIISFLVCLLFIINCNPLSSTDNFKGIINFTSISGIKPLESNKNDIINEFGDHYLRINFTYYSIIDYPEQGIRFFINAADNLVFEIDIFDSTCLYGYDNLNKYGYYKTFSKSEMFGRKIFSDIFTTSNLFEIYDSTNNFHYTYKKGNYLSKGLLTFDSVINNKLISMIYLFNSLDSLNYLNQPIHQITMMGY